MTAIPISRDPAVGVAGCPFVYEYTAPLGDLCGRPTFRGDTFCVFHSSRLAEKAAAFADALAEQREASFEGYVFPDGTDFSANDFGRANFARATFAGRVSFAETVFSGPALFDGASFEGPADFNATEFGRTASFWRTRWTRSVHFRRTEFRDDATFVSAWFEGEAIFSDTLFARAAHFQNARFPAGALFLRVAFVGPATFHYADLSRVSFRSMAAMSRHERTVGLTLATCQLRLARGLAETGFLEVDWGTLETFRLGPLRSARSYVLLDETLARIEGHPLVYQETERAYRALRLNATRTGDRRAAAGFHYGEREMERLALPRSRRRSFSWPALYWLMAGYGERPERPAFWLGLLLVIWAVLYALIASDQAPTAAHPLAIGFTHSLRTMTWQPTTWQGGDLAVWLEAFQRVGALFLAGLLTLCLARCFRR